MVKSSLILSKSPLLYKYVFLRGILILWAEVRISADTMSWSDTPGKLFTSCKDGFHWLANYGWPSWLNQKNNSQIVSKNCNDNKYWTFKRQKVSRGEDGIPTHFVHCMNDPNSKSITKFWFEINRLLSFSSSKISLQYEGVVRVRYLWDLAGKKNPKQTTLELNLHIQEPMYVYVWLP